MSLNNDFIELLGEVMPSGEIADFVSSIDNPTHTFVRYNRYKECAISFSGEPVEWCASGLRLDSRALFTTDPLFHAGAYYVQEASSMFLEQIFTKEILPNATTPLKVLDLCAAPGGKSTHISSLIGGDGLLVANEVIRSRAAILKENIIKWGAGNSVVTSNDPSHFAKLPSFFDVVVVDTPCSGEGMFRKNPKARDEWSKGGVELCAKRSRRIVADVWSALSPNGYLIYSTCTFNRRENEEVVRWISEEFDAEIVLPTITDYSGIVISESGYRFHPNRVDSEGYFVALLRKRDGGKGKELKTKDLPLVKDKKTKLSDWLINSDNFIPVVKDERLYGVRSEWLNTLQVIVKSLNALYFESEIGEVFGSKLKPSHALALSRYLNRDKHPINNLTNEEALEYLRRNTIGVGALAEGYNIVGYNDMPIGWVKRIGGRVNNLYPKESRILNY